MNDQAKAERDVWTDYFEREKQELIRAGMTAEAADDAASEKVRREIRGR